MNENGHRYVIALEDARTWPTSSASLTAGGTIQPFTPPGELGLGWVLLGSVALASISCAVGALVHHLF
jgi:hypothetical protein